MEVTKEMKKLIEENRELRKILKIEGITLIALTISIIVILILARSCNKYIK